MESREPRYVLRAAAMRLPYGALTWLAQHDRAPAMHRAEARREIKRRNKAEAAWWRGFLDRMKETNE